ncbi:MAG: RNA polymerase sigma factor [Bacillota bacterium]|nr:RNA polymerase sigma factor [Bacillota bacterium]
MDKAFFTQKVREKERSLYRIAVSYLKNDAEAADAVQDALLTAWEKRNTLRQTEYFGTWLTRILINRCKQQLRKRRPTAELSEQTPAGMPDTEAGLALRMALEELDPSYRIPLLLYHLDGYSVAEISRILLLPQGTVKSRLSRARAKLKNLLSDTEVTDDA